MRLRYNGEIFTVTTVKKLSDNSAKFWIIKSGHIKDAFVLEHHDVRTFEDKLLKDGYLDLDTISLQPYAVLWDRD